MLRTPAAANTDTTTITPAQRPCLSELLPYQPHTAHLLSLDFREMAHHNQSTRAETMLRTCAAQCGKPAATLSHNTTMAANLISMVFRIHHFKRLGAGAAAKRKPCLADLRLAWLVGLVVGGKHTHGKLWHMGRKNQHYSFETKMEAVIRYLDGDDPDWLAQEYGIKSEKLIHTWVKKWQNSGDVGLDPRMRRSINTDAKTTACGWKGTSLSRSKP